MGASVPGAPVTCLASRTGLLTIQIWMKISRQYRSAVNSRKSLTMLLLNKTQPSESDLDVSAFQSEESVFLYVQ